MGKDDDRAIILKRRAQFVAVALTAAGVASSACGGDTDNDRDREQPEAGAGGEPQPCLDVAPPTGGAPEVCLSPLPPQAGASPTPCLLVVQGGQGAAAGEGAAGGSGPEPCLRFAPPSGGQGGEGGT